MVKMLLSSALVTFRHCGHHPGKNQQEFQGLLPGTSSASTPKSSLPLQSCPFFSWRLIRAGRAWSVSLGGRSCNSQNPEENRAARRCRIPLGMFEMFASSFGHRQCLLSSFCSGGSSEPWTDPRSSGSAPALLPELPGCPSPGNWGSRAGNEWGGIRAFSWLPALPRVISVLSL